MASPALDHRILRSSPACEVTQHLRNALQVSSEDEITRDLLCLIELDSIAPTAFAQWLGISRSPCVVRAALAQCISADVRKFAIKELQKLLVSAQWNEMWDALGGTSALLELLSEFSVQDVKRTCLALACSAKGPGVEEKRSKFTELFQALLPRLFPGETSHELTNRDQRRLRAFYHLLVPACTGEVVATMVTERWDDFKGHIHHILASHTDTMQALALRYVFDNDAAGERWLEPLLSGYPSTTPVTPGISASMEFSLGILERLTKESTETPLSPDYVVSKLIEPLLKRAVKNRRRLDWSITRNIVDLSIKYITQHSGAVQALDLKCSQFVHMVGVCWFRKPDMFTDRLVAVLSLPFVKIKKKQFFATMATLRLLKIISKSQRYALMRLYFQVLFDHDLDLEAQLSVANPPPLTEPLLTGLLLSEHSLGLFARIRSARGDENLVDTNLYSYWPTIGSIGIDVEIWHTLLLSRCGRVAEAEEIARKRIKVHKQSIIGAGQEQRAINAFAVIHYAATSGSFRLYRESQEWARRFVRDPLTAKALYQTLSNDEIALLSGIPGRLTKDMSTDEIYRCVEIANETILLLFETVCLALREPAFGARHYNGVLNLFLDIVRKRIEQASVLKESLALSDEEMYDVLWKGTLKMLVQVEERGLSSDLELLSFNTVGGVLNRYQHASSELECEDPSTLRFFDNLAKTRDDIWRHYRMSTYPATAALPAPFPRGLPIQHLTSPFTIHTCDLNSHMPYLAARIDAAVFLDPQVALALIPEDQEARDAIGNFVDEYTYALSMMTPKTLDKEERKRRIDRVWSYATGPLSEGRFTPDEAIRYWKAEPWRRWFSEDYLGETGNVQFRDWPVIPEFQAHEGVEEWNPVPVDMIDVPERILGCITYIDMSLYIAQGHIILKSLTPAVPGLSHPRIFSSGLNDQAKARPAIREGQTLSALLFVDSNLPKSQLLSTAFPLTEEETLVRYPAVYLDGDFLSHEDTRNGQYYALDFLEVHLRSVPSSLLARLANRAYSALASSSDNESGYISLERTVLKLAKLLSQCDRPSIATKLMVQMVLDRPDNSSWHRQLLSRTFFRQLPASVAQDCMNTFAGAIVARVEAQAMRGASKATETTSDTPTGGTQGQQKPYVKITTVKLLAELLADTQCISEDFALSVLSQLLTKASHIDIRRAVVSSLLGMFDGASSRQKSKIISALEVIIPIAGNICERKPITATEWAHAEETLDLPPLDPPNALEITAPILWAILSFLKANQQSSGLATRHATLINHIILPIIAHLKDQTAKWTSIFLRKHGLDAAAQQSLALPPLPREQEVLHELLRCATLYLPLSILEDLTAYRTFNIAPPPPIVALNIHLTTSPLKTSPPMQSYLARYALSLPVCTPTFNPLHLLALPPSNLTGAITPQSIQAAYLTQYTHLLLSSPASLAPVHTFTAPLWPYVPGEKIPRSWATLYKPVVDALVLYTTALRTRTWDRDPRRHPRALPNAFSLRMFALRYAAQHSVHPAHSEEHCAAFAGLVAGFVDGFAGTAYHTRFSELKSSFAYLAGEQDRLRVACCLGDITETGRTVSWVTTGDVLRVELAAGLLGGRRGSNVDGELGRRVEKMIDSWMASESEEVRMLAVGLRGDD